MTAITGNVLMLGLKRDAGTWTYSLETGTSAAGYPPENMGVEGFSVKWRSAAGVTTATLLFDRGASPPKMGGIILSGTNLRRSAQVRIDCGVDILPAEPIFETSFEDAEDVSRFLEVSEVSPWGLAFGWAFPTDIAPRYIYVYIVDTGNPDGYLSVGAVTGSGYMQLNCDLQGHDRVPVTSGPSRSGFSPMVQKLPIRTFYPPSGGTSADAEAASVSLQSVVRGLKTSQGRIGWIINGGQGNPLSDRSFHAPFTGYGTVPEDLQVLSPPGAGALYASTTLTLAEATK